MRLGDGAEPVAARDKDQPRSRYCHPDGGRTAALRSLGRFRSPRGPPSLELVPVRVNAGPLLVLVPVDGESLFSFPTARRRFVPLQIGRDLLPSFERSFLIPAIVAHDVQPPMMEPSRRVWGATTGISGYRTDQRQKTGKRVIFRAALFSSYLIRAAAAAC